MSTTPQTLTLAGEDYVVIRRDEYELLRAAADEDATDAAIIQHVLDDPDQTWAPADLVRRIAEGEHPVRVWRTHRGMTARALAAAAGIPSSYLSAIERGVKPGSVKALKSLATALTWRWMTSRDSRDFWSGSGPPRCPALGVGRPPRPALRRHMPSSRMNASRFRRERHFTELPLDGRSLDDRCDIGQAHASA